MNRQSAFAPVAIVMGSQSDWPTMWHAAERLEELGVAYEARIVSAHRTPDRLVAFAKGASAAGYKVVIVDNLYNSSKEVINRIELICGKKPEFYELDIQDEDSMTCTDSVQ